MREPLNELLNTALADSSDLELYLNLLRVLPASERDIPTLARVSKRITHWYIRIAKQHGWASVDSTKRVDLTSDGEKVRKTSAQRLRAAEDAITRAPLEALVGKFDLELPWYPARYGPVDGSVTGGVAMRWGRKSGLTYDPVTELTAAEARNEESGGKLDVRNHGADWRPVPRFEGDTVSAVPTIALLSQTLMAFAIDYEGCGGLSLVRSGNTLRAFPDDGIEVAVRMARMRGVLRPVPANFAGLERHLYAELTVDPDDKRKGRLTLSEKGKRVRDAYDDIVAAIEKRWERRYGANVVRGVRRAVSSPPGV